MSTKSYSINKGINRPIEFRGLQAQYITWLGMGCVALLMLFAVLYLLGANPYLSVLLVLSLATILGFIIYRTSNQYGAFGLMKRMALRRVPAAITARGWDERLPILGVERGCVLSGQGDMTLAYRLTLPEIFTLSEVQYETLNTAWVKAIGTLPKHSILYKQDWFRTITFKPQETTTTFLMQSSNRHFLERPSLEHESYLFLTKRADGKRLSTSATSNLLRGTIVPPQTLNPNAISAFEDSAAQCIRILEETSLIKADRLSEKELLTTPAQMGLIERYCILQETPGERILKDISFKDGIRIGAQHCELYTLADEDSLPAFCAPHKDYQRYSSERTKCPLSFGASLGALLPCNHLYSQYIFVGDPQDTARQMDRRRRRLQSLSTYSRGNAVARDSVDAFLHEMATTQRLPVKAHFNVLVWGETKETLKDIRSHAATGLAQMDATLKIETLGAPQIFAAGIPGNAADFPMNDTFDTFADQAVCFLNQETRYRSSNSPVGLRLGDRLTGAPLHIDISDEPVALHICDNRNKAVFGPSGSGKSFWMNHLLGTYLDQGAHAVVIDVGHSYQGLCRLKKGYYFTYSEESPISFNPFHTEGRAFPDLEKRESIKALLLALWKRGDETFLRSEYVALSSAIQWYFEYLQPAVFPCFDTFYEFLKGTFAERLKADNVKDRNFDLDNFLYVLRPYYKGGEYDFLLNARENLDLLDQPFIVFEIDSIKDHPILFPVVTIIIMELFISKMRKLKGIRKVIVIEEAWKAIAREGMADYLKYLFKTVRKFYGEAIVVTQEVDDIISSPVVKDAIINNCDGKIILDQSKYQHKFEAVQAALGLTDKDRDLVLSLNKANEPGRNYKEVFIGLGGKLSKVYRLEVSMEEYLTYTTEEREKMEVMEYATRYGDLQKGISMLAMLKRGWKLPILLGLILFYQQASAQTIIQTILSKVITALDIKVQKEQLSTIELQDEQKETENTMTGSELSQITSWVQQEESLYSEYYAELWQIKSALSGYQRVKDIVSEETQTLKSAQQAYGLFVKDPHFSAGELQQILSRYNNFLEESARNLDQLALLINPFNTQMTDGHRLALIDQTADRVEDNQRQVQQFTTQNIQLSVRRARDENDLLSIQQLYGIVFQQQSTENNLIKEQIVALAAYAQAAKQGYQAIQKGLTNIKGYTQGEYGMHQTFFASLDSINPKLMIYVQTHPPIPVAGSH